MSQKDNQKKEYEKARRLAAISILFTSMFAVLVVYMIFRVLPRSSGEPGQIVEIEKLNPARSVYDRRYLVVNVQSLRTDLQNFGQEHPNVSIYFEYLNTGANISVNRDESFWPASLLKIPMAMAVARRVDRGQWNWDDKLMILDADKSSLYGTLYRSPAGTTMTIEDLLKEMLVHSDNTAYYVFLRNLGTAELESMYERLGFQDLFVDEEGRITARRYAILFRALYNAAFLSDESSQLILSLLSKTPFDQYLQNAVPDDVPFAHKFGVDDSKMTYLDAGIVYLPGRPYLIVVMVENEEEDEARRLMAEISLKTFQFSLNAINSDE
jgi:beta-lactamase class A